MPTQNKKYFMMVLGCQMNESDAGRIETILNNLSYTKVDKEEDADLIVVVACSVRQAGVNRVYSKGHHWKGKNTKKLFTILTGCVLENDKKKLADRFDLILPVTDINKIPQYLAKLKPLDVKDYFHIEATHESKFQAYVPIMTGCNNFCSYCVVPYVRGREMSRSAKEILTECQNLLNKGYKEIILLGQNVNSYHSGKYDFPKLLKEIDNLKVDHNFWLRFVTSHPKDCSSALIRIMANGKHIVPYLHLAVQSGDDKILKAMNRKYTAKKFLDLVKKARKTIPGVMISTDAIVGFPGETKKQFLNTLQLFKKAKFDMAYISQYSPRVHTVASKLDDNVTKIEKKNREYQLNEMLKETALDKNKKLIGQTVRVLVDRYKNKECLGKTNTFKTVMFKGDRNLIGEFVDVKITEAGSWILKGEKISNKLIVVLGPTACGKTKIGAKLAFKFNGEIISADSRQVYRGMDIGTGKDLVDYTIESGVKGQGSKVIKVPYHMIDVIDPMTEFNVSKYQKGAYRAINDVLERNKQPLLVGGTGLYIDAVTKGYAFNKIKDSKLKIKNIRRNLNKLSLKQLLVRLKKIDLDSYNIIDKKNRRRVQRALEIYYETGVPKSKQPQSETPLYDILFIGIKFPLDEIYKKIDNRLGDRIKEGMVREIKGLRKKGVTWKRLDDFGLEYRWVSRYLKGDIKYDEMVEELKNAIHHFAKRQLTWFKRNKDIFWVENYSQAEQEVKEFLQK